MRTALAPLAFGALLVGGCGLQAPVTLAEAREALGELALASAASQVVEGSIDLGTTFTLGAAVEAAAEEIRAFAESQVPCAEVTQSGGTVTIAYGATGGDCTYRGRTYTGTHTITVAASASAEVVVDHAWDAFSDGRLEVTGTAEVRWATGSAERRVEHDLVWTERASGRQGEGTGEVVQSGIDGDFETGVVLDGTRAWAGTAGDWRLDLEAIRWRWIDAVPEEGTYRVITPKQKTIELTFARVDDETIHVVVEGGREPYEFDVSNAGAIE
jgi:hypothetical protein